MTSPRPSRRDALRVAGASSAGVAAVGLTAACAGSDPAATASSIASQAGSVASSAAGSLVKAADIPVGGGKVISLLKVVITQPTAGDYKAFSVVCPHQGCAVNAVDGGQITCPCHGSTFDIATGQVTGGPARTGLTAKSVSVTADGIQVS